MIQWEWENEMISYQENDHIEQEKIWCFIFSWEKQEKTRKPKEKDEKEELLLWNLKRE